MENLTAAPSEQVESTAEVGDVVPVSQPVPPAPSLVQTGQAQMRRMVTVPRGAKGFNTHELTLETANFHFMLYGETGMRKTLIAALFGDPAETLIINTRAKEQMYAIRDYGYEIFQATDAELLRYILQNPDHWFEQRRKVNPKLTTLRYVLFDDATEGVNLILDDEESRDNRKNYNEAGKALRSMLANLRAREVSIGIVALAKTKENNVTNRDRVGPDLPPSMLNMVGAGLEYCFYVLPETYNLQTERDWQTFVDEGEDGKKKTYKVEVFAKSKLPVGLATRVPPVLAKIEKPNLREIWNRIQQADVAPKVAVKSQTGGIRR